MTKTKRFTTFLMKYIRINENKFRSQGLFIYNKENENRKIKMPVQYIYNKLHNIVVQRQVRPQTHTNNSENSHLANDRGYSRATN